MDGRIDPPPRRGIEWRGAAESVAVVAARIVCVVAGLAALGLGLVGMLTGTGLGPWGTTIGCGLLLLGLPWTLVSVAAVVGLAGLLLLVGTTAGDGSAAAVVAATAVTTVAFAVAGVLAWLRSRSA